MKPTALPSIVIDADPVLRRFGLPYYALARIRQMRVGDQLALLDFEAPDIFGDTGHVGATLSRERGGGIYRLDAGWMAHLGRNAQKRGHLWSWFHFKLLPHRKLELVQVGGAPDQDTRRLAFQQVEVVMRRSRLLARWAKRDGDRTAYLTLSPHFFGSHYGGDMRALAWLEKLRGPALRRRAAPAQDEHEEHEQHEEQD